VGGTEVQLLLRELLLVDSAVHAKRVSDREQEQHTHTRRWLTGRKEEHASCVEGGRAVWPRELARQLGFRD
jgi:hypothetical protein